MFFSLRSRWGILFQGRVGLCLQNKRGSPPILALSPPSLAFTCFSVWLLWLPAARVVGWFGVDERMDCVALSVVVWGSPLARSLHQSPPWQPTVALAKAPTRCYPHHTVYRGMYPAWGHWTQHHFWLIFYSFFFLIYSPPAPTISLWGGVSFLGLAPYLWCHLARCQLSNLISVLKFSTKTKQRMKTNKIEMMLQKNILNVASLKPHLILIILRKGRM